MRKALNSSIAVAVTFNSGFDVDIDAFDKNPKVGIALRVLYSALVQDPLEEYPFDVFWHDWSDCVTALPSSEPLNLQLAVDVCMLAFSELAPHRTGMLLLIDETRKLAEAFNQRSGRGISDESNGVYAMLGDVGRALNNNRPAVFNAVCTTLDSLMLQAVATNSGRVIDWVGLDGLRQPAVERMILCALGLHPASRAPALVALSIADCARHPRTLESLVKVLLQRADERKSCLGWFFDPGELRLIRRLVSNRLTGTSPLWAVHAALCGVALPYSAVVKGSGGVTFGDAISKGVFLNTIEADTNVEVDVPRLSFMHLLKAAASLPLPVQEAVRGMAKEEESSINPPRKSSESPFGGAGFEGFVLRWLQLRFGLAAATGDTRGLSLAELFALDLSAVLPTAVRRRFRRRMTTGTAGDPDQFSLDACPSDFFSEAVNDASSSRVISEVIASGGGGITFKANNPAFDILLLAHAAAGTTGAGPPQLCAIAIEARFSSPTSIVRTTVEHIRSKVALFSAQLGSGGSFAALGIPDDRVTYVIMASRLDGQEADSGQQLLHGSFFPPPSDRGLTAAEKAAYLAQGVIILDRDGVARALTPSLTDRAFFFLSPRNFQTTSAAGKPRAAGTSLCQLE